MLPELSKLGIFSGWVGYGLGMFGCQLIERFPIFFGGYLGGAGLGFLILRPSSMRASQSVAKPLPRKISKEIMIPGAGGWADEWPQDVPMDLCNMGQR